MEKKKSSLPKRIIVGILIAVLLFFAYPIRMPRPLIRFGILRRTPIGTSWEDAFETVENKHNWRIMNTNQLRGYKPIGNSEFVGSMRIEVDLGKSGFLWDLVATWAFDENGRLIDVFIEKLLAV